MMEKIISEYTGPVSLESLIPNLEALLRLVAGVDREWDRALLSDWETLEQNYAVMLADGRNELTIGEAERVGRALKHASSLVAEKLSGDDDRQDDG